MDPISKLTRLLEALRLQQTGSNRAKNTKASSETKHSVFPSESTRELPKKLNLDQLNRRICERISRLVPEERQSDKAVQLFVDSVLAWEFGEEILHTDSFSKYSEKVRVAIKSDNKLNLEFKMLLKRSSSDLI